MSFFNPYMKGPDIGQGAGDLMGQIMQMLMMKKMGGGQQTQQVPTPLPQQGGMMQGGNMGALMGGASQAAGQMNPSLGGGPQGGGPQGGGLGGLDPQMLQQMLSDPQSAAQLRMLLKQMGINL